MWLQSYSAFKTLSTDGTQDYLLLMAVLPRVCLLSKGDLILESRFALQTEPHVGSCLICCDFLEVISGHQGKL